MTDKTNTESADTTVDEQTPETVESTTSTRRQKILAALKSVAVVGGAAGIALAISATVDNVSQQALDHWWPVDDKDDDDALEIEPVEVTFEQIEPLELDAVVTEK